MVWSDAAVPATPTYCDADDVALVRREKKYSSHETRNRPLLSEVNELILEAEDTIDTETGHAWRQRRVTDETHDIEAALPRVSVSWGTRYVPIHLAHRMVRAFVAGTHKIEVWNGSTWEDWVQTKTEGRGSDWFVDQEMGTIYLRLTWLTHRGHAVRVTYDYGEPNVPGWVKKATKYLVAAELEETSRNASPGGDAGDAKSVTSRADDWMARATALIAEHVENRSV